MVSTLGTSAADNERTSCCNVWLEGAFCTYYVYIFSSCLGLYGDSVVVFYLAWSFWVAKGGTIWFENMVKTLPEIWFGVETSFSASFMPGLVGVAWSGDWAGILLFPNVLFARLAGCGTFSYCYLKMMWWECQGSNLLVELRGWTWDFSFYLSLKLN